MVAIDRQVFNGSGSLWVCSSQDGVVIALDLSRANMTVIAVVALRLQPRRKIWTIDTTTTNLERGSTRDELVQTGETIG